MDVKRKTWYSNLEKTFISRHILHQHRYTCLKALPVRRNPQHSNVLTVVSATFAPPFQPLRHQRNVCHQAVFLADRIDGETLPTVNRKHFFTNIFCNESFCPLKRTIELFGSILLEHGRLFDYWNQPLNMLMRLLPTLLWSLTVLLLGDILENLLCPLQLLYFHLWLFTDFLS
jgi:hypothetical protein